MAASGSDPQRLRWQAVRRALAAVDASTAAAAAAGDPDLARRLLLRRRRCWSSAWSGFTGSAAPGDPIEAAPAASGAGFFTVPVLARRSVTPELAVLRLARPQGFRFRAGQHVKLQLGGERRSYSLASAPQQDFLEFLVERHPGGLSERLSALQPGQRVGMSRQAKGSFSLDRSRRQHLMLATVTGVSPFLSMLRELSTEGLLQDHRIVLMHGASYRDELLAEDELRALAGDHPQALRYLPAVSRPAEARNAGWAGATGRLDALLADYLRDQPASAERPAVYACGNPAMVDAVAAVAAAADLPLRTERY